jgi:hypothetical protein
MSLPTLHYVKLPILKETGDTCNVGTTCSTRILKWDENREIEDNI